MSERDGPKSATGMQGTAEPSRARPVRAARDKPVMGKVSYSSSEEEKEEEKPKRAAPKRAATAKKAKAAESDEDAEGDGDSDEVSSHARGSPSCRAHACTDTDAFEHTWTMLRAQLARSHTHTHCESLLVVKITLVVCSLVKGEPAKRRKTTNGNEPRRASQVCTPADGGTHPAGAHRHTFAPMRSR